MADLLAENLLSIAQSFSVTKIASPHPHKFDLQLISPLGDKDRNIVESVVETVIKTANVDVNWLNKDVRFNTSPIADQSPVGGQPIQSILSPGLTLTEQGLTNPPGVAGLIAALKATIPIPVQETVAKPLTVSFEVQWVVLDENGNPAVDVQWTIGGASGSGGSIPLQVGQALTPLALTFTPQIVEWLQNLNLTYQRTVKASIRISARDSNGAFRATTGWVDLPPVTVPLPVVPVPTIALFFSGEFTGDTLISVPQNSYIKDEGSVSNALDTLNNVLGTLDTTLAIGSLFISNLSTIKNALNSAGKKKFREGDACGDLRDVKFAGASFTDWNGEDGDDHFDSLMMIGPPQRAVECFNDRQFSTDEGQITLRVDNRLFAKVSSLAEEVPTSDPADAIRVPHHPSGWRGFFHHITTFADELSSYRFVWW